MSQTFTLHFRDHVDLPERKKLFNERLFTEVAPKYDFVTRVLSVGRDAAWKRHLVGALPDLAAPHCVDLACGTGDVSFLLARKYPRGTVVGLDLTDSMLRIAARRAPPANLTLTRQDMCATGLPSAAADIVTGSYALRNAPDLDCALEEIGRLLKPGGVAAFLDFSKPRARFPQAVEYGMLKSWGSLWGLLLHGNHEVYAYIADSLRAFPDRAGLHDRVTRHGLTIVKSRRFYFGVMELLVLTK